MRENSTQTSGKVSRAMRNLEASYNPGASGILSQVASWHVNEEIPQEVQQVIKSNCARNNSANLDNQNQEGQTHIIEDIDDDDHETGRETVMVSF